MHSVNLILDLIFIQNNYSTLFFNIWLLKNLKLNPIIWLNYSRHYSKLIALSLIYSFDLIFPSRLIWCLRNYYFLEIVDKVRQNYNVFYLHILFLIYSPVINVVDAKVNVFLNLKQTVSHCFSIWSGWKTSYYSFHLRFL